MGGEELAWHGSPNATLPNRWSLGPPSVRKRSGEIGVDDGGSARTASMMPMEDPTQATTAGDGGAQQGKKSLQGKRLEQAAAG